MKPYRKAPRERAGETRRRELLAFSLLTFAGLSGCAHTPEPVAPETQRLGPDLFKTPSPLFDDEARPGAQDRHALHPKALEKLPTGGPAKSPGRNSGDSSLVNAVVKTGQDAPASSPSALTNQREDRSGEVRGSVDPLEDLFQALRLKFGAAASGDSADDYSAIERADLESKLIALFFLRDKKKIEDYRDLIRSFGEEGPTSVELELLKAALYQKVGQADLRDRALERIREITVPSGGALKLSGLAFAKEIRGYRSFTPLGTVQFAAGEEILIYGEIEGFRSTPVGSAARPTHRRSFAAELVLRDGAGAEIDRRELLRAGHAVELVEDPSKPVHFWGRYPLPARLSPGSYRLEVEAQDLEAQRRAKGKLTLRIR